MGAAKKIEPLKEKTAKTQLTEVPKKTKSTKAKKAKKTKAPAKQQTASRVTKKSGPVVDITEETVASVSPQSAEAVGFPAPETFEPVATDVPAPGDTVEEAPESLASAEMPVEDAAVRTEAPDAADEESGRTPDLAALARTLTRAESMTDEAVDAMLHTPEAETSVQPEASCSAKQEDVAEADQPADAQPERPGRDMSKIALFASLAAVILLLGLYVHLNQNLRDLALQVQDLGSIKSTVATLDTKIGTMESKVADLETLPARTRATLMSSILQEMGEKTSYMSTQLNSPEQQEKLMRAKELIQQVQTELNAQQ